MKASTMLQLKISKTKKRLSDERWFLYIGIVGLLGLLTVFTFALRPTILSAGYGLIAAEIPVLAEPIADPTYHEFEEKTADAISTTTPAVILTRDEFIFGDMAAFSTGLGDVRNKFSVKHRNGAPDIDQLLKSMSLWEKSRAQKDKTASSILVFMPTAEIPVPIVMETIVGLRKAPRYQRVVLAAGIQ